MILLRRLLTVPLGLVLVLLLFLALALLQINATFLDPDYYTKLLRKADVYEFVLVDLTRSALDEARELDGESLPDELDENPLVLLGLSNDDIVSSLNRAIPPDWVQGVVEQAFDQGGEHLAKSRDEFSFTLQAGDQVTTMVSEIKSLLRRADSYNLLFEELLAPAAEDAVGQSLPFGLSVTDDRLVASARRVIPPEWVQEQVEAALDEVTPYIIGERDHFEVTVQLSDRVDVVIDEIKSLMREVEAPRLLYDHVIEPALAAGIGEGMDTPVGVTIPRDEVLAQLKQVAPPAWVQQQADAVIDKAGLYFTGRADDLEITISLAQNKRDARGLIVESVTEKVRLTVENLPGCTLEQIRQQAASAELDAIPECLPPGVTPDSVLKNAEAVIVDSVDTFVLGRIPDEITFTDAVLREELMKSGAGDNIELIDDVRKITSEGWSYTERGLREDMRANFADGDDVVDTLDDIRDFLSDGWTYTEVDLREDITDEPDTLDDFDRSRNYLARAKTFRFVVFFPTILLLAAIGFLGGRHWSTRFAWAAGSLVVTSSIILLLAGVLYRTLADEPLDDLREDAITDIDINDDFAGTERLATEKALDILDSVVDGFASGVAFRSLIALILGIIALVVSLRWTNVVALAQRLRQNGPGAPAAPG